MNAATPPSIFTLTGNLLAERTWEFSDWTAGRTQRAQRESFQVGGKGINVSKMLQRLGAATTALCFTGGAPGAECAQWLARQPFASHVFSTVNSTRSGLVVRGGSQPETTFFGPDAAPDAAAIRACADFVAAQPRGQVLAICGSIPGWSTPAYDPLRTALIGWLAQGRLAVDTYGPPLEWFAAQPLTLVKINATELRSLFPREPSSASISALLQLAATRYAARRWIVSDGAAPVWFQEGTSPPTSVTPPRVHEVSPTGSGDVLFAGVLEALFRRGATLAESVSRALPLAAANAAHPGVADFPLA